MTLGLSRMTENIPNADNGLNLNEDKQGDGFSQDRPTPVYPIGLAGVEVSNRQRRREARNPQWRQAYEKAAIEARVDVHKQIVLPYHIQVETNRKAAELYRRERIRHAGEVVVAWAAKRCDQREFIDFFTKADNKADKDVQNITEVQ